MEGFRQLHGHGSDLPPQTLKTPLKDRVYCGAGSSRALEIVIYMIVGVVCAFYFVKNMEKNKKIASQTGGNVGGNRDAITMGKWEQRLMFFYSVGTVLIGLFVFNRFCIFYTRECFVLHYIGVSGAPPIQATTYFTYISFMVKRADIMKSSVEFNRKSSWQKTNIANYAVLICGWLGGFLMFLGMMKDCREDGDNTLFMLGQQVPSAIFLIGVLFILMMNVIYPSIIVYLTWVFMDGIRAVKRAHEKFATSSSNDEDFTSAIDKLAYKSAKLSVICISSTFFCLVISLAAFAIYLVTGNMNTVRYSSLFYSLDMVVNAHCIYMMRDKKKSSKNADNDAQTLQSSAGSTGGDDGNSSNDGTSNNTSS